VEAYEIVAVDKAGEETVDRFEFGQPINLNSLREANLDSCWVRFVPDIFAPPADLTTGAEGKNTQEILKQALIALGHDPNNVLRLEAGMDCGVVVTELARNEAEAIEKGWNGQGAAVRIVQYGLAPNALVLTEQMTSAFADVPSPDEQIAAQEQKETRVAETEAASDG
jgi:hypothetical protein